MIEELIDILEWFEFHNKNLTKAQQGKIDRALYLLKNIKNKDFFLVCFKEKIGE